MQTLEQFLAVAAVFALLGAALWLARRRGALLLLPTGNRRRQPAMRVIHRVPLTAQHCLHIVETGDSLLLVGTHPGGLVFAPQASAFELDLQRAFGSGTEVGK